MKFIFLKRGFLILLAAIVCIGAGIGIFAGVAASNANVDGKIIVIDAGHGGVDAGVTGVTTAVKESDINLYIARELKNYFIEAGFRVVMTRSTNGGLYGTATKGFKMRDMKKRKEIIEQSGADMVISVHQNSCPIPSRRGGQVFYDTNSESGKALAGCIQNCLNALDDSIKPRTALIGDYYMLKCTQSPSVIVECGFLSNSEDESLLLSPDYRKKIAYTVFKGAVSYYS